MTCMEIQKQLEKQLDAKRFTHTQGVMYTAASLAMRYQVSMEDAMLAGVLHDCAKAMNVQEQYQKCQQYGIVLNETEQQNGALIHAKLGAYLAQHEFGVDNEEILRAITYHTTGAPNMTVLEKILYIADYIEPNRRLPEVERLRVLAFQDLDQTMLQLLELTIQHLQTSKQLMDASTLATYEYYKI